MPCPYKILNACFSPYLFLASNAPIRASLIAYLGKDVKGSIKVGKLADVVVLSRNILQATNPADILKTDVLYTVAGGKIVYKK